MGTVDQRTPDSPSLQDASRGGSGSSIGSKGDEKAEPQGATELPQGSVSGSEQRGGAEEAEGATVRGKAHHGQGPLCQTLDVEQVDLQLEPWSKAGRPEEQAKKRFS